jgi:hypothetical protein
MLARKDIIDWGARLFGAPARSRLRCGHLLVEFSRGENEVCLASKRLSDEEADTALDRDEPVSWTSWAVCTGAKGVKVLPGLPDLPVLARQDSPFRLLPGEETRVYLRIPVSVKVCLGERDDELLAEFPSETMPRVWFGEAPAAEECYQLGASASRALFTDFEGSEVQAPVLIRNESREVLEVTQICLRVARLSLYRLGSTLWTNETIARYQGGMNPSRLSIKSGPPLEAPSAKLLAPPRETGPETIVGRTFRSFRRWAEWR